MIAIIDYGAGNTRSLFAALSRLGVQANITDKHDEIASAEKVILPGVGQALAAYRQLEKQNLIDLIPSLSQPVLGICLGMQLLAGFNEEGNIEGIGVFKERVRRFPPTDVVPHMGWNGLEEFSGTLFKDFQKDDNVYFAHSYYVEQGPDTVGTTSYILPFSAALHRENFYGVQFHPEKSANVGEKILLNFLSL
jgi:glutamine amidotransferase